MKIAISLNETLRDFVGQILYTYDKYIEPTKLTIEDIKSLDLTEYLNFDSIDKLNTFLYLEAPLEIFGHADQLHDGIINKLNEFLIEMEFDGEHTIELVSREVNKAIPSTLFFLSKTGCRVPSIRFVKDYASKWDDVDVLITANPKALEAKPEGKISVKVKSFYNTDAQADYEINSLFEFFNDEELRNKILKPIITTTYEEL